MKMMNTYFQFGNILSRFLKITYKERSQNGYVNNAKKLVRLFVNFVINFKLIFMSYKLPINFCTFTIFFTLSTNLIITNGTGVGVSAFRWVFLPSCAFSSMVWVPINTALVGRLLIFLFYNNETLIFIKFLISKTFNRLIKWSFTKFKARNDFLFDNFKHFQI